MEAQGRGKMKSQDATTLSGFRAPWLGFARQVLASGRGYVISQHDRSKDARNQTALVGLLSIWEFPKIGGTNTDATRTGPLLEGHPQKGPRNLQEQLLIGLGTLGSI